MENLSRVAPSTPKTCSQLQSPFFMLPAELRAEVYLAILAGDRSPVILVSPLEPPNRRNTASLALVPSAKPLLRTCRRMREELNNDVSYIVATSEFSFATVREAESYLDCLTPAHRNLITSLLLDVDYHIPRDARCDYPWYRDGHWPDYLALGLRELGFSRSDVKETEEDLASCGKFFDAHPQIRHITLDFSSVWSHWRMQDVQHDTLNKCWHNHLAVHTRKRKWPVDLRMRVCGNDASVRMWVVPQYPE